MNNITLRLLSCSVNHSSEDIESIGPVDKAVIDEMVDQAVFALPAKYARQLDMSTETAKYWNNLVLKQVFENRRILVEQERITDMLVKQGIVPVVIKGFAAALYYENPDMRTTGDIDIIPFPKNEEILALVGDLLREYGYAGEGDIESRHIAYFRKGFEVEVHSRFLGRECRSNAAFDDLIMSSKPVLRELKGHRFYTFDDLTSGLVFLAHVMHHIKYGLGFRQIFDWFAFASECLHEKPEQTEKYLKLADETGLRPLAVHLHRLGERYFGLPEQEWSSEADEEIVEKLFDMADRCGNFGHAQNNSHRWRVLTLQNGLPSPRFLQIKGLQSWKAAQEHRALRPFAWAYQLGYYFREIVIKRPDDGGSIGEHRRQARDIDLCMEALGLGKHRE